MTLPAETEYLCPSWQRPFVALLSIATGAYRAQVAQHMGTACRYWLDMIYFGRGVSADPAAVVPKYKFGVKLGSSERVGRDQRLAGASDGGVQLALKPILGVVGVLLAILCAEAGTVDSLVGGLVVNIVFSLAVFSIVIFLPLCIRLAPSARRGFYHIAVAPIVGSATVAGSLRVRRVPVSAPLAFAFFAVGCTTVLGGAVSVELVEWLRGAASFAGLHFVQCRGSR